MTIFEKYNPAATSKNLYNISVRLASLIDALPIAQIIAKLTSTDINRCVESIETSLQKSNFITIIAEYNSEIVGYSKIVYCEKEDAPKGWYVGGILVQPNFRRRGVGEKLTEKLIEIAKSKTDTLYSFINAQNKSSITLHEKLGFVEFDRRSSIMGVTFEGGVGIFLKKSLNSVIDANMQITHR